MNLRHVAHELLNMRGKRISVGALRKMTDAQVCELANIPLPNTINKCAGKGKQISTGKVRPILFQGNISNYNEDVPYVHMERSMAMKDLKHMKQKKEVILKHKKVHIEFDFGFENPFVLSFTNGKGYWTREDLVLELVRAYEKCYRERSTYKPWCNLSYVCVYQLYKDPAKSCYSIDVDIID